MAKHIVSVFLEYPSLHVHVCSKGAQPAGMLRCAHLQEALADNFCGAPTLGCTRIEGKLTGSLHWLRCS